MYINLSSLLIRFAHLPLGESVFGCVGVQMYFLAVLVFRCILVFQYILALWVFQYILAVWVCWYFRQILKYAGEGWEPYSRTLFDHLDVFGDEPYLFCTSEFYK